MNKKEVNWNDLQLFLVVAREGGLSSASKMTKQSPATLGRRMHKLERDLGKELFIRHDRGYQLTSEGMKLFDELALIEDQILQMASLRDEEEKRLVKISAGTWTTLFLILNMEKLLGDSLDIRLRFISTERILDITHREVVIGFRNKRPTKESLVCRRMTKVEFAAYSTINAPQIWIKVIADTPSALWVNKHINSESFYEVNEPRNSLDLVLSGKGIAVLPTFIGDTQESLVRQGNIIEELSHDQWLVTHQVDRFLPEVRLLIDRLEGVFSKRII
ncbi:LysR family transcriptional regulator [Vibrio sp. MACH09]|uniref:LysR family transcriptional regulator n=1 Tax=Vibrio sp. MACH09 TaxID=3025122 RepID=UPI002793E81A|nr:LysR family transcriptional regulator [Vibrio sp. MACH09]GLO62428.1 LysR family transcriptional regulator [Vibrio sp. MACH09]